MLPGAPPDTPGTPPLKAGNLSEFSRISSEFQPQGLPAPDVTPGTRLAQNPLKTYQKPLILGPGAAVLAPDLARILPDTGGHGPQLKPHKPCARFSDDGRRTLTPSN